MLGISLHGGPAGFRFGGKLRGIDVRGRFFLPLVYVRAVKFQDGLQRDFTHVLLDDGWRIHAAVIQA